MGAAYMHSDWTRSDLTSLLTKIVTGLLLYSLTTWTIIGNIFVTIALFTNKKLKQGGMSNYLIGNLAISDLLLGLIVLPFSATLSTFNVWPFGVILCHFWLSIDVLCSTASIWGLLVISLDRFIATNHPILYMKHRNNVKLAVVYCTMSWFISITISLGPLLFISGPDPTNSTTTNYMTLKTSAVNHSFGEQTVSTAKFECVLFHTPSFVILSSIGSFYLPLALMTMLYMGVFYRIRQKSKQFNRNSSGTKKLQESTMLIKQQNQMKETCLLQKQLSEQADLDKLPKINDKVARVPPSLHKQRSGNGHQHNSSQNSEARVTKKLAIIMGAFVACWLPFFIIYIIRSLLSDPNSIPDSVMSFFIWLGYFNSSLNPILYAILNENFRVAFKDIIFYIPDALSTVNVHENT